MDNINLVPPWPAPINLSTYVQGSSDYEILCWVVQKLKETNARIENMISEAVSRSKTYTDEQLKIFKEDFAALEKSIYFAMDELEEQQTTFIETVNNTINAINAKVDKLENDLSSGIIAMQAYTDLVIKQNNEYILQQIENQLISVKVINFFTGELVTIQQMFDILAQYHLQDAMTYNQYAGKNVTYDQLVALSITYSQLINNGNNVVHQ